MRAGGGTGDGSLFVAAVDLRGCCCCCCCCCSCELEDGGVAEGGGKPWKRLSSAIADLLSSALQSANATPTRPTANGFLTITLVLENNLYEKIFLPQEFDYNKNQLLKLTIKEIISKKYFLKRGFLKILKKKKIF